MNFFPAVTVKIVSVLSVDRKFELIRAAHSSLQMSSGTDYLEP